VLQFQRVYVIGLPERTDKRDAMTVASSITGFTLEWIDGVRGQDMVEQAWPAVSVCWLLWSKPCTNSRPSVGAKIVARAHLVVGAHI
jgi:hypothetical protein